MNTQRPQRLYHLLLALVALSATTLTGCLVVGGEGQAEGSYSEGSSSSEYSEYEESEEYEEYEESEESTMTTTTTTTTTTTGGSEAPMGGEEVNPEDFLFFEDFEGVDLSGSDRATFAELTSWSVSWAPESACAGELGATIEVQAGVDLGAQGEADGLQHARLDAACGSTPSPVALTTSLMGVGGATRLAFYARAADGVALSDSNLRVYWGGRVVMDEPLLDVWSEYEVDLTMFPERASSLLSFSPSAPGALVDFVRVY